MSGVTGLGTTYNLPNYTGLLFSLTPTETPLFSAIGGLTGGGQATSTEFEWETYDLRAANQNVALEGATAPTAQQRVRGTVKNVVQIAHEKVSVSYSKLAAYGQKNGINNAEQNPVQNESDFQITAMLKQMVRDIEFSFLNGVYLLPTDNTTKRQTRGILNAITTNVTTKATSSVTGLSAATDTVTETTTGLANGDKIVFTSVGVSTGIELSKVYFVVSKTTNAFKVAETLGGSAVTIGTATVAYTKPWTTDTDLATIEDALQGVYDSGGLGDTGTATLIAGSRQKRGITAAYQNAYGKFSSPDRTVGGVAVSTILTDFGTLNVMLNRMMPPDAIAIVSMDQLRPVFLETPGKGHFFAEPLAKTGASDEVQLYGEVGLEYGSERSHGVLRGLKV